MEETGSLTRNYSEKRPDEIIYIIEERIIFGKVSGSERKLNSLYPLHTWPKKKEYA